MKTVRKRITLAVTSDLSYDQRIDRIAFALTEADFEVFVIGRRKKQSIPLEKKTYSRKRLNCFFEKGKLFYLEFNFRLFFFLLFNSSDIICANDLDTILPCTLVCIIKRKTLTFDSHEYFTEVPEVVNRPKIQFIWEKIANFCIPYSKLNYTVSESLAKIFEEKYNAAFITIRNIPFKNKPSIQPKHIPKLPEKYFIYCGAVNQGRGLENLIAIFENLNAFLVIAGDGDLYEKISTEVKRKKLESRILLPGYVKPEEMMWITQNAFAGFNLLENSGLSYYYSAANKFFDYANAGIPQICINFPEYISLNHELEVALLTNLDSNAILNCINTLENDQDLFLKLKTNCKKSLEVWNWENESLNLADQYKKL